MEKLFFSWISAAICPKVLPLHESAATKARCTTTHRFCRFEAQQHYRKRVSVQKKLLKLQPCLWPIICVNEVTFSFDLTFIHKVFDQKNGVFLLFGDLTYLMFNCTS